MRHGEFVRSNTAEAAAAALARFAHTEGSMAAPRITADLSNLTAYHRPALDVGAPLALTYSQHDTTADPASLLSATNPVVMAGFSALLLGAMLTRRKAGDIGLAFCGLLSTAGCCGAIILAGMSVANSGWPLPPRASRRQSASAATAIHAAEGAPTAQHARKLIRRTCRFRALPND
jgi:hypothetical protein